MEKLSVFIITYNCARTLGPCLESVKWADEIVMLDSASTDGTLDLAEQYGCTVHQTEFLGYGKTKQLAIDKTRNNWVLHVDADEMLSPALQDEIRGLLESGPPADGYMIPRLDQIFWEMNDPRVRLPEVDGRVETMKNVFYHFSEVDIHSKVEKINGYSTGLVADKVAKGRRPSPWILVFYPPLVFIQQYVFKRNFFNGWAGFIGSVIGAFYAFLRYAKLYEHYRFEEPRAGRLPEGAPDVRDARDEAGRIVKAAE
jgi:glycosyltransferase involved in cell wall biosynthesis